MNMLPYMAEKTSDLIKLRLLNRGEIILGYQGEPHVITAASKREAGRVWYQASDHRGGLELTPVGKL